jgi:sulfate-transporting ATPase
VRIGKTVQMAFVDQSRDALANDKTVWEDISGGLDIINVGKFQMPSRAYCGASTSTGRTSRRRWACSRAVSAAACTWPRR